VGETLGLEIEVLAELPTLTQTFSHFQLTLHVFDCQWQAGSASGANCQWVRISALEAYPMGKGDRQIARELMAERRTGARRAKPPKLDSRK
jgi:hypothetical protein